MFNILPKFLKITLTYHPNFSTYPCYTVRISQNMLDILSNFLKNTLDILPNFLKISLTYCPNFSKYPCIPSKFLKTALTRSPNFSTYPLHTVQVSQHILYIPSKFLKISLIHHVNFSKCSRRGYACESIRFCRVISRLTLSDLT